MEEELEEVRRNILLAIPERIPKLSPEKLSPDRDSDILSPLAMDQRGILPLGLSQVGYMGYSDQLADRFGGAQNKVDIAGKIQNNDTGNDYVLLPSAEPKSFGQVTKIHGNASSPKRPLLRNLDLISNNDIKLVTRSAQGGQLGPKVNILRKKFEGLDEVQSERLRQNLRDLDGKAGPRSAVFKAEKVKASPKSPLVRIMQLNEVKWAESLKTKVEKSSLKKQRKKEKEAKLLADYEVRKGNNELQMLFDKIALKKQRSQNYGARTERNVMLEKNGKLSSLSKWDDDTGVDAKIEDQSHEKP